MGLSILEPGTHAVTLPPDLVFTRGAFGEIENGKNGAVCWLQYSKQCGWRGMFFNRAEWPESGKNEILKNWELRAHARTLSGISEC